MSDQIALGARGCPCGRSFAPLTTLEGRQEDVLELPTATGGRTRVHPNLFHRLLDDVSVAGWQVTQRSDRLQVHLAGLPRGHTPESVHAAVAAALTEAGVLNIPVENSVVAELERTRLGKVSLVTALKPSTDR